MQKFPAAAALALFFLLQACGSPFDLAMSSKVTDPKREHPEDADLNPISPNVVYAKGWSEIVINTTTSRRYIAKVTITPAGHYSTSQNLCWKEVYGVLPLELWNKLATHLNKLSQTEPSPTENCVTPSESFALGDFIVKAKINNTERTLYEYKSADGLQICNNIADTAASTELMNTFFSILDLVEKEDCPNSG